MNYQTLVVEKKENIEILYLNRPQSLNALTPEMRLELLDYLARAKEDNSVRVVIVSGKGRAFSAGGDLFKYKERYETFRREGRSEGALTVDLPRALFQFPKPMIAAINGAAVGFGVTMPLSCDVRIASTDAKFGFGFTRVGATPEFGSSYYLPRLLGYGKAAELIFTAKSINAEEALQIGLVNSVVAGTDLIREAEKIAGQIAKLPPGAIRASKQLLRHGSHATMDQTLEYETLMLKHVMQTPEHYEALCLTLEEMSKSKNE